jgi:hypothetical protein
MFENRNFGGSTYEVAIYRGNLFRMDHSHNTRPYSTADYKYFTTNSREASAGYSRTHQKLREWRPSRPLVLLHLLNKDTRTRFRNLLPVHEQENLNFSFPVANNVVGRRSEGEHVNRNYSVSAAVCRLFGEHGIDGYYIGATPELHSEIVLCQRALQEVGLQLVSEQTLSAPRVERAPRHARAMEVEEEEGAPAFSGFRGFNQLPPRTPPRAAAAPMNLFGAQGFQTPPRAAAVAQGFQTPPRGAAGAPINLFGAQGFQTPPRTLRRRQSRRLRRTNRKTRKH